MATYKVPQDVEADDKLIGPFSFRQFIYLIIVAMACALAWGLAQVFIGLVIIPLPIILLFGALALPLRKDQPMEIYLAALVSFYLKPHKRLWDPDGIESLIEITVPKTVEVQRTKDITQADAEQRFSYLANIVDSGGWAIRGAGVQAASTTMNSDVFLEAQGAQDILDTSSSVGQSFNAMMDKEAERMREQAIERMRQPASISTPAPASAPATPSYNPYPTAIQQTVIQPVDDPAHQVVQPSVQPAPQTPPTTSDKPVSADIMNLANNPDLSIETLAREAHRLQDKEDMSEEVVISLR
jgi:hypothetical protein